MGLDLRVHHQKVSKDGSVLETTTRPYLRIAFLDFPPVYLQNGQFHAEEVGTLDIDDLPEWVVPELGKCSDLALKECGCPEDLMQDVMKARAAYKAHQRAELEAKRKRFYGDGKSN